MTEEVRPEQERSGEEQPDLFPPSCSPEFHPSLPLAEQCETADAGAWASFRAVDRVTQSRAGKGRDGSEDTCVQECRGCFVWLAQCL